jgi:tetratricopeptide (TPR) repeat protein
LIRRKGKKIARDHSKYIVVQLRKSKKVERKTVESRVRSKEIERQLYDSMVVVYDITEMQKDDSGRMYNNSSVKNRKSGGLVSQRVDMYETPTTNITGGNMNDMRKSYNTRQQQSQQQRHQLPPPPPPPPLQEQQQQQSQYISTTQYDSSIRQKNQKQEPPVQQQLQQKLSRSLIDDEDEGEYYVDSRDDIPDTLKDKLSTSSIKPRTTKQPREYAGSALIQSGVSYYAQGDYDKALQSFLSALKTQRVSVGDEDDICIALTLGNLGSVYLQQDNIKEAEKVLYESLQMKRRIAPEMLVADNLNNLGNCANLNGEYAKSMDYYKQALEEIASKDGGLGDEVNALFNIGRLEIQRRNWNEAMNSLNQACRLAREHYGTNHAFVAQTLDLMGFVQLSTKNMDSAMVSFTGALAIYRRIHGPMHMDVANSLFNVGMVREAKNDLSDAWEAYTTSRDLFARLGTDPDHPGFLTVRRSIANVEKTIAKQNRQKLVTKHIRATKHGTPPTAATTNNNNNATTKSYAL